MYLLIKIIADGDNSYLMICIESKNHPNKISFPKKFYFIEPSIGA